MSTAVHSGKLDTIQVLRFVAAGLVVLSHVLRELTERHGQHLADVLNLGMRGQFGVDLFFVISGFIMVYVTKTAIGQPRAVIMFAWRRVIRLAPLYWAFTTATIIMSVVADHAKNNNDLSPAYLLGSYAFFPVARSDGHFTPALGVGWTLNYELFFYLLFAAFMLMPRRVYLYGLVGTLALFVGSGALLQPSETSALWFWTRPILLEFAGGMLLADLYQRGFRLGSIASGLIVFCGLAWWLFADQLLPDPTTPDARFWAWGPPAIMIMAGCCLSRSSFADALPNWLRRAAVRAGDTSYSLYLSHLFVLRAVTMLLPMKVFGAIGTPVFILVATAGCFVGAELCFRFLEQPLGRLVQNRKRPPAASNQPIAVA